MTNKTKNKTKVSFIHNFSTKANISLCINFFGWKRILSILVILALIFVWSGILPVQKTQAAGLDTITTTLSAAGAGAESKITVVFTPSAALSDNDRITVYIGELSTEDPWIDTDATISATDVTCTQGATVFDGKFQTDATATTGVTFGCDVAGAGADTPVTVSLGDGAGDDMYNPVGADIYTVSVVTTDDSGAGVVYVGDANDVTVSVTVLGNLSMLLDGADGTYCTGTPVVTCNLGVVLTTTVAEGYYDINVGTNATSGATVQIVEDGDFGTIDDFIEDSGVITAGTEEYGIEVSDDGAWDFAGIYFDNDSPIEGAATDLASTGGPIAETGDDITVTHRVAIDSLTAAGSHSHTVTYTVAANF